MKAGDLVQFKSFAKTPYRDNLYIVKGVGPTARIGTEQVTLYGLPDGHVFMKEQLEVLSESR